jgi:demethylmenaquinone methyltransferase / 2-methoxy-6-polyprenyl-1,4-benzoquinol methylase
MFDSIAPRYDLLNHLLSAGLDRCWRRRAIGSLGLTGGEHVLDVCTGTADLAIGLRTARPPAARVTGIDFAGAMLGAARKKLRGAGVCDTIALVRADATRLPVADESVDAVTVAFGIRNVENAAAACREMHRVLRPGGRFAILEFSIPGAPALRTLYRWYFNRVVPRIGRAVSGQRGPYDYLPASVEAFASPDELAAMLRESRFADVTAGPLAFGIVFLYTGRRIGSSASGQGLKRLDEA